MNSLTSKMRPNTCKIVAVVIWFNPDEGVVRNLLSYSRYVSRTIIIDNSTSDNSILIGNCKNVNYYPLFNNLGIAAALNIGYKIAEELRAKWVLTMDQDSSFSRSEIKGYLDLNSVHFKEADVAVIGPNFEGPKSCGLTDCNAVISSGALVDLKAHNTNGGYNESFFIDYVDFEYCFRLKRLGYRVLKLGYISMNHTVGSPLRKVLLGRVFHSHNHSSVRKYYITRNGLYMRRNFGEFGGRYIRLIFMDIINVLLIESDKYRKLMSICKGFWDYSMGRTGPMI